MNSSFSRTLTFLRKERGISQKEAAASLKISQALLSHYEKGIRECGLDFVVRVADFYGVSCDYLLGRTADKSGTMIAVDDIPESGLSEAGEEASNGLPVLNKKLIINSITIIFDLLQRYAGRELTAEVSSYLNMAIYTVFRELYTANPRNPESLFSVPNYMFAPAAGGAMGVAAANIGQLTAKSLPKEAPILLPEELTKTYPLFTSSLLNLLKNAETRLAKS